MFTSYRFNLVVLSLNSAISTFKPDVQDMMKNFTGFAELWEKVSEDDCETLLMIDCS
jgi:hypothetical protein